MVAGSTSEPRTVTLTTTNAAAGVTAAAGTFSKRDAGRPITATGIPAGATLLSVTSDTAATLSANATASGSRSAVIGSNAHADAQAYGYAGWSPESLTEAEAYTLAQTNLGTATPDRLTNTTTGVGSLHRARG
jgi:hypothetical protein